MKISDEDTEKHMNMKRILIILFFGLISFSGSCQEKNEYIKINKDLELIKISENAYIHISYKIIPEYGRVAANGLIFINKSNAFLFDTPWSDSLTMVLVTYLKDHMGLTISGFVPNHWHEDCMGGLRYLQSQGIVSYANQKTIEIATTKSLPQATYAFKDSLQLNLNDKVINCYFFGAAHSRDNIVVWIPSEKILFPGCMVKGLSSTDIGNITDGDIASYPKVIEMLIKRFTTAEIVIPGHGRFGGLELLKHTRDLLSE
jgi:metallo-beta-lactamase class B